MLNLFVVGSIFAMASGERRTARIRSGALDPTHSVHRRINRRMDDTTCNCDTGAEDSSNTPKNSTTEVKKPSTIRLVTVGGNGNGYYDFFPDRMRRRVDLFYERTGIQVEIVTVGGIEEVNAEMLADSGKGVYDGFGFLPNVIGGVVDVGGLADLTPYVAGNADIQWTDILPQIRENAAAYNGAVRSLPCDGDIHSLFYRKDLFAQYNLEPPRTWDEYTERAAFFHGKEVPAADGNGTVIMSGSCVERNKNCDAVPYHLMLQVHSATAQSQGTGQGLMFDSESFKPNLGEGFAETLRHLENQVKYGAEEELGEGDCRGLNVDFIKGECAMTYYWGDIFSRHLYEISKVEGKLGVAATPGVTKVFDVNTGKLIPCDEETCPYGRDYPDIGRVNLAPFAAAGGWSVGVAGGLPQEREAAMTEFIGLACGAVESVKDVITEARSTNPHTGADPYRKSHLNASKWVEQGYPMDATRLYLNTVESQYASPNMVLDTRFAGAVPLQVAMANIVFEHLAVSKTRDMTHQDRMSVARSIEERWNTIITDFEKTKPPGSLSLAARYRQSLNVYVMPQQQSQIETNQLVGLVVGCSLFVGIVSGLIIYFISQRKLREQQRIAAEELAAKRRLAASDDDSDCESIISGEEERDEVEEIKKLTESETRRVQVWRVLLVLSYLSAITVFFVIEKRAVELSPTLCRSVLTVVAIAIGGCFFLYDQSVRSRTKLIVANAALANAVVTSMFPGQFREQMMADQDVDTKTKLLRRSSLKEFIANGENDGDTKQPLADLFLNTTVMFADVVGFTAWSSAREPSKVFTLLEAVYSAFDGIAARRGIFKVETVGDCYVAVTGLPDPRKDHAVAMARFANNILIEMASLTRDLEVSLGPDTTELTLRIGMHSGPVTGGVLRGARSRFQLFGDTMNTTARIESTGLGNRIHVSEECAKLLSDSGKASWLEKREKMIVAKGKGVIQTYWVNVRSSRSMLDPSEAVEDPDTEMVSGVPSERQERLILWHVEQFVSILKNVVARRAAEMAATKRKTSPAGTYKIIQDGASLLDDVKEIIELPEYNEDFVGHQADPDDVVISEQVQKEMYDYVAAVCATYRPNAFHNFEHASAVTLSVLKLLSRIVAPEEKEEDNNAAVRHDHTYGITSDPLTQFACAFSAMIHDADHPGIPNSQLVKERAPVATEFGNRSVAEQNSLVICWDLLMQPQYSDFRRTLCATQSELDRFRSLVVNSVLATDIVDKDLKALRNARWEKAFNAAHPDESLLPPIHGIRKNCIRETTNRKATIVIEHLIQASDVCHTMQHWHVYRKWNERLFQECYASYKAGRAATDPSLDWYKGEIGFFDFYIIPLAKKLKDCGVFGKSSDEFLNYAVQNRAEWEMCGQEVVNKMIETIANEERIASKVAVRNAKAAMESPTASTNSEDSIVDCVEKHR